jgi:nucleoid DNA-binding protein
MAHNRAKALTLISVPCTLSLGYGSLRAPPATMSPLPAEEMCMTKAELVDHVATTMQLSKSQTDAVLTQCLQAIMDALQAGESVELRGFGRFHLRHRQARAGRNPRTGEMVPIPAKAVPTFAAGKAFQEQVQPRAAAGGTA